VKTIERKKGGRGSLFKVLGGGRCFVHSSFFYLAEKGYQPRRRREEKEGRKGRENRPYLLGPGSWERPYNRLVTGRIHRKTTSTEGRKRKKGIVLYLRSEGQTKGAKPLAAWKGIAEEEWREKERGGGPYHLHRSVEIEKKKRKSLRRTPCAPGCERD